MLPLRHTRRWQASSLFLLFLVLVAALTPAAWYWDDRSQAVTWFNNFDKILHVVSFLILSMWFSGLYHKKSYWRIALGLLAFGLVIEVCQRVVGYRTADWADVAADGVGIVLGLIIATAGLGGWCLRVEEMLNRR